MKKNLYAVYEMHSKKEMCLGVWDSVGDLALAMETTPQAIYRNLYQTNAGRRFSRSGFAVFRIPA